MIEATVEPTAPVRRYGKPRQVASALEEIEKPTDSAPQDDETLTPGLSFGSSALFGGLTARDNESDEEDNSEREITLEEIKKRYLNLSPSTQGTQESNSESQSQTQQNETQQVTDQKSLVDEKDLAKEAFQSQTQLIGNDKAHEDFDISRDTVDMLSPSDHKEGHSLMRSSPEPTRIDLDDGATNNGASEDEDEDDDIIVHKKRPHHVIADDDDDESVKNDNGANNSSKTTDHEVEPVKKSKKLSKKESEETEKESYRMERGLELAPQARTNKQITVQNFLDIFEKPSNQGEDQHQQNHQYQRDTSDISPHKSSGEENSTPFTSPPSVKTKKVSDDPFTTPGASTRKTHREAMPGSSPLSAKPNRLLTKADFMTPRRLASFINSTENKDKGDGDDDDDDDLEIIPSTKASTTSKAMQKLANLAHVNPYAKKRTPVYKPSSPMSGEKIGRKSMLEQISCKQREQALRDRDERIAEFRARGGTIMNDEEKSKEAEAVESLLEQERQKAEKLRKQEAGEYDEEEDEDYRGSDEEEVGEEEEEDENDELEGETGLLEDLDPEEEEEINELQEQDEDEDENVMDNQEENELEREEPLVESSQDAQDEDTLRDQEENEFPGATQLSQFPDPTQTQEESQELNTAPPSGQVPPPEQALNMDQEPVENEDDDDDDDDEDRVKISRRRKMTRPAVEKKSRVVYDKKKSAARAAVDDEAMESEDEWAGIGGDEADDDGQDPENYNLENLVDDNSGENAVDHENNELWNKNELERDDKLVNKLMEDVTTGGWRRRRAQNDGLLDLSDDEGVENIELERARREEQKRLKLLEDANLSNLASNPKAKAFIDSIADRSCSKSIIHDDGETKATHQISAQDIRASLSFLDGDEGSEISAETIQEAQRQDTLVQGDGDHDLSILRSRYVKTVDRIHERRSKIARAKGVSASDNGVSATQLFKEDVEVLRRRSVASMSAKFKSQQGVKDVRVMRTLSGPAFGSGSGGGNKSSVVKRTLKPTMPMKKERVIPKSSSSGAKIFKKGNWA